MTRVDRIAIDGILIWWAAIFLLMATGATSWRAVDIPRVGLFGSLFWVVNVYGIAWVLRKRSGLMEFVKSKWRPLPVTYRIAVAGALSVVFLLLMSALRPVAQ